MSRSWRYYLGVLSTPLHARQLQSDARPATLDGDGELVYARVARHRLLAHKMFSSTSSMSSHVRVFGRVQTTTNRKGETGIAWHCSRMPMLVPGKPSFLEGYRRASLAAVVSSITINSCGCKRASYFASEFGSTLRPAARHTNLASGRTGWCLFEIAALHRSQRRLSAARYGQEQAAPLSRSRHKAHDASLDMHIRGCRGADAVAQVLIRYRKQLLAGVPSATRERAADANDRWRAHCSLDTTQNLRWRRAEPAWARTW